MSIMLTVDNLNFKRLENNTITTATYSQRTLV